MELLCLRDLNHQVWAKENGSHMSQFGLFLKQVEICAGLILCGLVSGGVPGLLLVVNKIDGVICLCSTFIWPQI